MYDAHESGSLPRTCRARRSSAQQWATGLARARSWLRQVADTRAGMDRRRKGARWLGAEPGEPVPDRGGRAALPRSRDRGGEPAASPSHGRSCGTICSSRSSPVEASARAKFLAMDLNLREGTCVADVLARTGRSSGCGSRPSSSFVACISSLPRRVPATKFLAPGLLAAVFTDRSGRLQACQRLLAKAPQVGLVQAFAAKQLAERRPLEARRRSDDSWLLFCGPALRLATTGRRC